MHSNTSRDISDAGGNVSWILLLLAGGFAGWPLGGRTILRHIGEREWRNRLASAKTISGIWNYWFRDPL